VKQEGKFNRRQKWARLSLQIIQNEFRKAVGIADSQIRVFLVTMMYAYNTSTLQVEAGESLVQSLVVKISKLHLKPNNNKQQQQQR
jgi:dUTPase